MKRISIKELVHFEIQPGQRRAGCGAEVYPPWTTAGFRKDQVLKVKRIPEEVTCVPCLEFMLNKKKKEMKRITDQIWISETQ